MTNTSEPAAPNTEQAKYWTSAPGRKWIELQEPLDILFAPLPESEAWTPFPEK